MRQSPQGMTAVISTDFTLFGICFISLSTSNPAQPSVESPISASHPSSIFLSEQNIPKDNILLQTFQLNQSRDGSAGKDPFGKEKCRKKLVREEALTVGRLVGFHTLSFHNGHIVNSNVPFDSRATDPFKDELEKRRSEGFQ